MTTKLKLIVTLLKLIPVTWLAKVAKFYLYKKADDPFLTFKTFRYISHAIFGHASRYNDSRYYCKVELNDGSSKIIQLRKVHHEIIEKLLKRYVTLYSPITMMYQLVKIPEAYISKITMYCYSEKADTMLLTKVSMRINEKGKLEIEETSEHISKDSFNPNRIAPKRFWDNGFTYAIDYDGEKICEPCTA